MAAGNAVATYGEEEHDNKRYNCNGFSDVTNFLSQLTLSKIIQHRLYHIISCYFITDKLLSDNGVPGGGREGIDIN